MKNIYLLQNSCLSFDIDISKLFSPEKYLLLLIINEFGLKKLNERNQAHYFKKIWVTENFTFDYLKEIILSYQNNSNLPLQIVTNAEEAIVVCGNLRLFFNTDILNFDRFKNKLVMKELLTKQSLLTPKHVFFDKQLYCNDPLDYIQYLANTLTFPLIAKPIDSMGCMGIQKIVSIEELSTWCNHAAVMDEQFEIDEFINGKVYNCDSYIKNNKILFTQVSACSHSCYDFIKGFTKGTIALPHYDPLYKLLCDYTITIHDAIKIPYAGVTHLEVIMTNDKKLYFIEIGHRSPGILIPAMYEKFLGITTLEAHILLQIDNDFELNINIGPYSAWIAFPTKKGQLKTKNKPYIKSNYQLEWTKEIGDNMSEPTCGRDYAGRALLWNPDYQQLKEDFDYLNSYQFYNIYSNTSC